MRLSSHRFIAWPLEGESHLKSAYFVEFGPRWDTVSTQLVADVAPGTMRPTPVLVQVEGNQCVLLLGGRSDRSGQLLNTGRGSWHLSPRLPLNHNITNFIAVNYKEQAIFTFVQDVELAISSAALDLARASWVPSSGHASNSEEMDWALHLKQSEHGISNLLLRSGTCLRDGTIVVVATGSKAGMPAQIGGLLLHFSVQGASGNHTLALKKTQFFFPSIVPRFLD